MGCLLVIIMTKCDVCFSCRVFVGDVWQDLESEMTSQRAVLESLTVTGRQMSRGGSSSTSGNSDGGGGALLEQLEDMNQRSTKLAAQAADIRSVVPSV